MFIHRVRSSLLLRTTLAVLGAAVVIGLLTLAMTGRIASQWELARQRDVLGAQLDGVEAVASAACFAEDPTLAEDIVKTLVGTRNVQSATLSAQTRPQALAQASRGASAARARPFLTRSLPSPFSKDIQVGTLVVVPDLEEAARQGAQTAVLLRAVVLALTMALAITLAIIVQRTIVRPIATLSARLHQLEAETGALLSAPPGHEADEIGRLALDVNALVERLVETIRNEHQLGEKLALDQRKMQVLMHNAGTGIFVVDGKGALESWTPAFQRMLRLEQPPAQGAGLPGLFGANQDQIEACLERCRTLNTQVTELFRIREGDLDSHRWLQLSLDPRETDWIQGLLEDVTSFRDATDAAQQLAVRDTLTGALNRLGGEQALAERFARGCTGLALMMVDLDRFKEVNDTHGHDAGDEVLRQACVRIAACLRKADTVVRLGGDEFLLILDFMEDPARLLDLARKVIEAINQPILLPSGAEARVGASIGIVLQAPDEAPTRQALLKRADLALYQAKEQGRNRARVFEG